MENGTANTADHELNVPLTNGGFGETEGRVVTPSVGTTMFHGVKSLMGKSFEMSVGHIVLVVAILALVAGFLSGVRYDRSRMDQITWDGKKFIMVGLIKDNSNNIYFPVYQDERQVIERVTPK